jgi:HK97 family phage major capsid protein
MFVKILKAIAGTSYKVGEIVDVEEAIAKAYVAAGYCEESKEGQGALDATIQTELTALRSGIADVFKGVVEDVKKAAGAKPVITPGEAEAERTKSFNDMVRHIGRFKKHGDAAAGERLQKVYGCTFSDEDGNLIRGFEGATGATGGVMIAPEYASELLKLEPEAAVIADGVRTVPMAGETKRYPALRQTGKNAPTGGSNYHGGIVTYRRTEKAQRTGSDAKFDFIELKATDLTAYTQSTRDLLADAPGIESDFMMLLREALAWQQDYDFLLGPGAGEPIGIYNAPATVDVNRQAVGEIQYLDFVNLLARIMPRYWGQVRWIANVTAFPQIANLQDDAGNNIYLPSNSGVSGTPTGVVLGRPVRFCEFAPVLGAAGDLAAVVPGCYLHGLRSGVEIAVSEHYLFLTDEIAYRAKLRNDGQPWMKAPFRQADSSNTQVSCFAKLKATTS